MFFATPSPKEGTPLTHIDKDISQIDGLMKKTYEFADKNKTALPSEAFSELRGISAELMQLSRSAKRWKEDQANTDALMDVSQVVNSSLEMDVLLQIVMDIIIKLTGAERGFLMLLNDNGVPEIRIARNWEQESIEESATTVSRTLVNRVLTDGEAILTDNASMDTRFGQQASVIMHNLLSIVCVPLKLRDKIIGVMYADNRFQTGIFSQSQVKTLSTFANQAAIAIENARLFESLKKLAKIEQEMEIARRIQIDFLPSSLPQLTGWEFGAGFNPARDVAGDFFDAFYLSPEHLCLVIADVCDKGVGAALFMALIRSLIRAFSEQGLLQSRMAPTGNSEVSKLKKTNRQLTGLITQITALNAVILTNNYLMTNHSSTNMFATLFLGVLDLETGKFIYVNAGHNPPYLIGKNGIKERFKATGPAVGMIEGASYTTRETMIEPEDLIYAFTDGVTEARAKEGGLFMEFRLEPLLTGPINSPEKLIEQINLALEKHTEGREQSDDITMLAIHRLPKE